MNEAAIDRFCGQLVDPSPFVDGRTAVAARTATLMATAAAGRFTEWLMIVLAALAEHCAVDPEDDAGVAVLQSPHGCWTLEQGSAENGIAFLRRLATNARRMAEPWFVVALSDPEGVMWWYAEARGHGIAAARVGRLGSTGDADAFTGEPIHPSEAHSLGRVLYGHPARRRFPLRGH